MYFFFRIRPEAKCELFTGQDEKRLRGFAFLTAKPLLAVVNMDETDAGQIDSFQSHFDLGSFAGNPKAAVCAVSAKIEMEIAGLAPEDAEAFRNDLGIHEPCLERILHASHRLLGLSVFFTGGDEEVRAWSIPAGLHAHQAAGVIHSDIERGFIRAEVISYEKLMEAGSHHAAREKGWLRQEGKEYRVAEGDVIYFKFNV